ncbi:MAG TPA: cyclic peptide export ABC transporter [Thermoanaerobaculia bacterium]|nr:cyclic peptide export ABC transporter [Thermoanaerobaculia bacterium]
MRDLFRLIGFLLRLSREIKLSRATMGVVAVAGIISGLANTGMIALITSILSEEERPIALLTWGFVGLCVVLPVFRFFSQVLLIDLTQKSLLELRVRLAERVLSAPLRHLESLGRPKLLATLTNDIGVIVESLILVPVLFMHLAIVVSCLAYLGYLSWLMLLQISAFIVIGVITYQLPVVRAMEYFHRSRQGFDAMSEHLRSLIEGTKELKMHQARQKAFLASLRASIDRLQRDSRTGQIIFTAASSWGQILFFVVIGLLVLVLPRFQDIPPSTLIAYTIILFHMMTPLEVLLSTFPNLSRAAVAARTVEELGFSLQSQVTERSSASMPAFGANWQSLDLVGLTHSYRRENEEESFLLGPINLSFKPGELVFIVGGNGSGKTTLAKMMIGLYAPENGEVRFGGRTITDETREWYREHFSVVFADFFVFEKLLGIDSSAIDEDARRYLKRLHLEQKVQVQDGELSTVDLSQGQRKRLALLTAYLEDRPIYLFDEWAADQDPLFKEIFYLELLPELKARGKTVFVISHDDHYYYVADRILKVDYGRIESDRTSAEFLGTSLAEAEMARGRRGPRI